MSRRTGGEGSPAWTDDGPRRVNSPSRLHLSRPPFNRPPTSWPGAVFINGRCIDPSPPQCKRFTGRRCRTGFVWCRPAGVADIGSFENGASLSKAHATVEPDRRGIVGGDFQVHFGKPGTSKAVGSVGHQHRAQAMSAMRRRDTQILQRAPALDPQTLHRSDRYRPFPRWAMPQQPSRFGDKGGATGDFSHQADTAIAAAEARKDVGVQFAVKTLILCLRTFTRQVI